MDQIQQAVWEKNQGMARARGPLSENGRVGFGLTTNSFPREEEGMEQWRNKRVGVLLGGLSAEQEISRLTGTGVCQALRERGYTVTPIEVDARGAWISQVRETDVVFIALHGKFGEDGTVQGCWNFGSAIHWLWGISQCAGDEQADGETSVANIRPADPSVASDRERQTAWKLTLSYPVVVKPSTEGSSVGVSIVRSAETLQRQLGRSLSLRSSGFG